MTAEDAAAGFLPPPAACSPTGGRGRARVDDAIEAGHRGGHRLRLADGEGRSPTRTTARRRWRGWTGRSPRRPSSASPRPPASCARCSRATRCAPGRWTPGSSSALDVAGSARGRGGRRARGRAGHLALPPSAPVTTRSRASTAGAWPACARERAGGWRSTAASPSAVDVPPRRGGGRSGWPHDVLAIDRRALGLRAATATRCGSAATARAWRGAPAVRRGGARRAARTATCARRCPGRSCSSPPAVGRRRRAPATRSSCWSR